ncbi:MAG: peptide chain release factor 1 [Clostridia bacterium]
MLEKTLKIKQRFEELTGLVGDPKIIADMATWKKLVKERSALEEIAEAHDRLAKVVLEEQNLKVLLGFEKDKEMSEMLEDEILECKKAREAIEEEMKVLLLPKDENDDKNVIVEIRGGAGGEEAALFANVLFKMYTRYAERKRWKIDISYISETGIGGYKEAVFMIQGKGAFSKLKFESGVHRVQRIPETETQGRVQTSTVTVAMLPEVEEVDFEILDKDLRVDTYRSSGAGGQHVNKTDSAIRLTHLPTGIVVSCQDERSQIKNRERAFSILKSKLFDFYQGQITSEYAKVRKNQVGSGDRSERIRTYNYPQGRITDHRINFTIYSFNEFLDGDIDEMLDELSRADQKLRLEAAMQG